MYADYHALFLSAKRATLLGKGYFFS